MNQKSIVLIMLLVVVMGFGGVILWDVKTNNRLGLGKEKQASNWEWDNNWSSEENPNQPIKPEDRPDHQIVASTYTEALAEAGKYGMPVFVYFEGNWCVWCKKMKSQTLNDSQVKEVMKNYVLVYVDSDKNRDLAKKFGVRVLPSYVITNCEQANLKNGKGYQSPKEFAKWLDNPSLYQQPKKGQEGPDNPELPPPEPYGQPEPYEQPYEQPYQQPYEQPYGGGG